MSVSSEKKGITHKSFASLFILLLIVFEIVNFVIWICFTREILKPDTKASDLVRLSYLVKIAQARDAGIDLPRRHIPINEYSGGKIDMVTDGDTFSMGGGAGKNPFYQDYIASNSGITVVNIPSRIDDTKQGSFSPVETLAVLYNSGMLDRLKPRYLLLESVERYAPDRLFFHFRFDETEPLDKLAAHYAAFKPVYEVKGGGNNAFINEGNLKFVINNIKDKFPVKKINDTVYRANLRRAMFSGDYGNRLYYYFDEYTNSVNVTGDVVRAVNDNLNFIADKLAEKNIRFVFMPVVSKLDLYGPYLDPPRNDSIFFEELRKLPKRYIFIDTKELLREAVQRGEKDIFFMDDTHWTWKASKHIFEKIRFK